MKKFLWSSSAITAFIFFNCGSILSMSFLRPLYRLQRNVAFVAAVFTNHKFQKYNTDFSAGTIPASELPALYRIASRREYELEALAINEQPCNSMELVCMTYNMCNAAEVQRNHDLYKKYAWTVRLPRMIALIKDENPDIVGFQEIRGEQGVHIISELQRVLSPLDYELVHFRNNASELSLINVIAYKKDKVTLDRISRYWSSETPDQNSDSWGDGWGRLNLVATFYPSTIKHVRGQKINGPDYTFPAVHYINVHNGLGHAEKMGSNRVHVAQAQQLIADKEGIVIVGGDFNNFDEEGRGGKEEMAILEQAGFVDLAEPLKTASGVPVSGTFPGYAYDRYKAPKGTFGTQLDHMHCKVRLLQHRAAYWSYVNAGRYNGVKTIVPAPCFERELLQTEQDDDDRDFPSDHLPIITRILIRPTTQAHSINFDYWWALPDQEPEIPGLSLR